MSGVQSSSSVTQTLQKAGPGPSQSLLLHISRVTVLGLDFLVLLVQILWAVLETVWKIFKPEEMKSLRGEVAVITGAGHGIGRCLAIQLSQLGVRVACWDVNLEGAENVVREVEKLGGSGLPVKVDVSDREAVRRAAQYTRTQMGEVTLLFNNAGIMPCKPLLAHSETEIEKVFAVNVFSQFWTIHEFLPRMITLQMGHIVSMCSVAGVTGTSNLVPYCSSKFAIKGMMDALHMELRATRPDAKVKLTTIHPFTVNTGLAQKPRSRFQSLFSFTSPEQAAEMALGAMRRDHEYAFIPTFLCFFNAVSKMLPRDAQIAILEFLDCGCDSQEE